MSATNETTGKAYQGRNVLRLLAAEAEHGYDDRKGWAGFHQWLGAGRVVTKGEHGTACVTVIGAHGAESETARAVTDSREKGGKGRGIRGFRVFHYDQTEELTEGSSRPIVDGWSTPRDHTGRPKIEAVAVPVPVLHGPVMVEPDATDAEADTFAAQRARLGWGAAR